MSIAPESRAFEQEIGFEVSCERFHEEEFILFVIAHNRWEGDEKPSKVLLTLEDVYGETESSLEDAGEVREVISDNEYPAGPLHEAFFE